MEIVLWSRDALFFMDLNTGERLKIRNCVDGSNSLVIQNYSLL